MKKKLVKVLEFVAVIVALVVAVFVATQISVESMLRGKEEPVSLAQTEEGLPVDSLGRVGDYIGLPAGDDIPRIEDAESWEYTTQYSYVTIEPVKIISTGIGSRHPWIDAYTPRTRRRASRKRPDVTSVIFDIFDEYAEYQILQLPDESYILAQLSKDDVRKLKAGKKLTLPIGHKYGVHNQAMPRIATLCEKYNVNTNGVFYCINDQWNESHQTILTIIRFAIGFVVTIVLGTILIMIIDKIFKVKD